MKDKKLTILLSMLGVIAIGFVGFVIITQEDITIPGKITPATVGDEVEKFKQKVDYPKAKNYYTKLIKQIQRKADDNVISQGDSWIDRSSAIYATKVSEEVKRYCLSDKYTNAAYNQLKGLPDFIMKSNPRTSGLEEMKQLQQLISSELDYSAQSMWLTSSLDKKIAKEKSRFSASYDWTSKPISDWYRSLKSKIYATKYVSKNPYLGEYFDKTSRPLADWKKEKTVYREEYSDFVSIKESQENGNPVRAINSYRLCKDFSIASLERECKIYKDRAFIRFIGCGISGSDHIGNYADADCLKGRAGDCWRIKKDGVYYKRCLDFTD